MVTRGEALDNLTKLVDMQQFLTMLVNLHETALFQWVIEGTVHSLPQDDIDEIIARYQTLKTQLSIKYGELL